MTIRGIGLIVFGLCFACVDFHGQAMANPDYGRRTVGDGDTMKVAQRRSVRQAPQRSQRTKAKKSDRAAGAIRTMQDMDFAWIPGGKFSMGSKFSASSTVSKYGGKEFYWEDEHPKRTITLTKGFWMAVHEVRNLDFEAFVESTSYLTDAEKEGWSWTWDEDGSAWKKAIGLDWRNPGWDYKGENPVVCVSWNDSSAYVGWLNEQGLGVFRLPSEAEWEYACRGGSTKVFPWGDSPDDAEGMTNGADMTANGSARWEGPFKFRDGYWRVAPAKSFKPNEWGLYDTVGNVREWCQDWYESDYYGKNMRSDDREDPKGPEKGSDRVVRGGSWFDSPPNCRPANRLGRSPDRRNPFLGFRVAM